MTSWIAKVKELGCRDAYSPCDNVSPGFRTPVIRADEDDSSQVKLHTMRWGLVPSFNNPESKPDFWRMFNARSESLSNSPVFRRLLSRKRCIVLTQGFYEWHTEQKVKQPYYIHLNDEDVCCFAGLYDSWTDASGEKMYTYTILTTDSSERLQWLHTRMPVLLRTKDDCEKWLRAAFTDVAQKLNPYNEADLVWHPVTTAINRAGYRGDDCCKPLKRPTLNAFFKKADGAGEAHAQGGESHITGTKKTINTDESPKKALESGAEPSADENRERDDDLACVNDKSASDAEHLAAAVKPEDMSDVRERSHGQKRKAEDAPPLKNEIGDTQPSPKRKRPGDSANKSPAKAVNMSNTQHKDQPSMLTFFKKCD